PNFRPSDIEVGPDGGLYFLDWHNPIIGHLQHHLRDPSRDHAHGRIYRITAEGRPLAKPAAIAGAPVSALMENLKSPDDRVRYRTKIELSGRDTKEVIAAAQSWAAGLDKADKDYEHRLCEALWVHQWHNVVNEALLKQVLAAKDPNARAAGTRVLCYWRDRVAKPLDLLKKLAVDDHPRVRLEAVRACSYFTDAAAIEVALESANKPEDKWVKFALDEAMKTLEKHAK
ncbi:MAG TPA: HEAT repeat domain-containing protein, partial [Tepidisphaeraceae bacterium]|nr:HEAT repeat domain-containing protein [Tepidisphaeraceae bacterium]